MNPAASVSAFPVSKSDLTKLLNDGGAYDIAFPERRDEEEELTKLYTDGGEYIAAHPERRDEDEERKEDPGAVKSALSLRNVRQVGGTHGDIIPERESALSSKRVRQLGSTHGDTVVERESTL